MTRTNLVRGVADLGIRPNSLGTCVKVLEDILCGQDVYLLNHSEIPEIGSAWPASK